MGTNSEPVEGNDQCAQSVQLIELVGQVGQLVGVE